MNIEPNIKVQDLFLIVKDVLIISDIHVGYEESLHKQGYFIPKGNLKELNLRIEKVLHEHSVKTILINGDLIHSFSKLTLNEKDALKDFIKNLQKNNVLKIIRGNHDKILHFLIPHLELIEEYLIDDILITHGDKLNKHSNDNKIKKIIIGHEHPSILIQSGPRKEKYKCFLKGKYQNKIIIVMPSCNLLVEGTDILREELLSPYLKNIDNFKVYVVGEKTYDFGKVNALRKKFI